MAKVYVGNLSWNTTDDGLAQAFSSFGQLTDYIVMKDRDTGRSRGFGFVTFMTQQEADAAILSMNEKELDGRRIRVNMANSRPSMMHGGLTGASLGYSGLTGGYGAGAYNAAQNGFSPYAQMPTGYAFGQAYPGYQQQPYGAQMTSPVQTAPGVYAPPPGYAPQHTAYSYGGQQFAPQLSQVSQNASPHIQGYGSQGY